MVRINNKSVNELLNVFKVTDKATRTTSTELQLIYLLLS